MSKAAKKKSQAEARLYELEIKKRNGILVIVAAFVGMAAFIAIKLFLQYQLELEWANSMFASLVLFVLALVAAGIAGWGSKNWRKARDEITMIRKKYKL